jgi:uncharacterized protein (DUF885 family)
MQADGPSGEPAREFRSYLAADWTQWLTEYPETATEVGFPGLNDRWRDDSATGIERRRRHLLVSLDRIRGIERARLPEGEQLSYDLYRELLESAEAGLPFGDDPLPVRGVVPRNLWMPLNQLDGVHIQAPETLDVQPRQRLADYGDILSRLDALPAVVDQNLALLETGQRRGYTPPRVAVRGVPGQVAGVIPSDPMASPLLRPFVESSPGIPSSDGASLLARALSIFTSKVAPAFDRLHDYLVREYLPACREAVAATSLPDGPAAYAHHVRWQTTTDLTPQQIHEIGLAEVARIRAAMQSIVTSTGFSGSLREFNDHLRTDPRFCFARAEELVDGYRVITKRIDPTLARLFGRLPRLPYGVLPVPEFRSRSSPAAYYQPGAPATGRPGYFFVNTYDLHARFRWEMEALALHESVPGHHLQISIGQEAEGAPEFRKFAGYSAFIEGWGLYAESLGEELGLYEDAYSRYGQLTYDMWRSIRLVVDTGMHALGWSRDRAIDFFRENTGKSDLDIGVEVDRYIVWPGQALAYKLGQRKFRELRTLAEARLGERFDVRRFHDCVLEQGALPLGVLERRVRGWIDRTASAPP